MPTTTEAYVARQDGACTLETVHYPDVGDDEILVDTVSFSICHTDVRAIQGAFLLKPPMIPGHESAGYIKEIGKNVKGLEVGDAVVLSYANCGACRRCLSGKASYCDHLFPLNFSGRRQGSDVAPTDSEGGKINGYFFGQSSMSRTILAHACGAVKVECSKEELPLLASLSCGIQTGYGAIVYVDPLKPPYQTFVPHVSFSVYASG